MPKRFRACFHWLKKAEMTAGKVTLFTVLAGSVLSASTFAAYFEILIPFTIASTVSTTVTVLNTPPQWDTFVNGVDQGLAHELVPSATNTPTKERRFEAAITPPLRLGSGRC